MADADLSSLLAREFIEGDVFADVEGKDVVVENKELYRCTFRGGTLAGARFARVIVEACVFEDCDLTRITLPHTSLRGVRFVRCKLLGVHFAAVSDHPEISFEDCDLRYAVFDGQALRGTKFIGCGLQDSSFNDANLVDADFSGSDLDRAGFNRCDLGGADFSTAQSVFLDPAKNKAKDALIGVDAAVAIVRAMNVRVAGYDEKKPPATASRRRR